MCWSASSAAPTCLRALARALEAGTFRPHRTTTTRSCERILAELAKAAWVPRDGLAITVTDGIVDLDGVILDEKEREALRVVAENTPGVKAVEDHLVWIEPVSGTVIDSAQDERTPDTAIDQRGESMRSLDAGDRRRLGSCRRPQRSPGSAARNRAAHPGARV